MAEQNRSFALPLSSILIILAALGVTLFQRAPLKSERPPVNTTNESPDRARARLWQDPFNAVLDHEKALGKREGQSAALNHPIAVPPAVEVVSSASLPVSLSNSPTVSSGGAPNPGKTSHITILAVMVPGGPFEGDSEWRMRIRYAVLSGLGQSGFVPLDENHVNYTVYQPASRLSSLQQKKRESIAIAIENILPYEWFKSRSSEKGAAVQPEPVSSGDAGSDKKSDTDDFLVVVWINDENAGMDGTPLKFLDELFSTVTPGSIEKQVKTVKVIGPATSTTLVKMVQEVKENTQDDRCPDVENRGNPVQPAKKTVQIYSPLATGDIRSMIQLADAEKHLMQWSQRQYLYHRWYSIERTINNDREVAQKIIDELCLRDINSAFQECTGHANKQEKERLDHIVLISEWDNVYSRTLPESFKTALREKSNADDVKSWVDEYSYMRGIDGMVPGEAAVSAGAEKKDKKAASQLDIGEMEKPSGKSQLDYLRRLAVKLAQKDRLYKSEGKHGIRAVGILGSDYFDKYLILQAVRQELPDVLYFTTNLDARMLQPEDLKWTRNLVVGSPYGLTAHDAQGETPPFRDAYQTSLFVTTRYIFADKAAKKLMELNQPRIYEIGNRKAYRLAREQRAIYGRAAEGNDYVHPSGMAWKVPLLMIFAGLLLYRSSHSVRRQAYDIWRYVSKHPLRSSGGIGGIILFARWFYADIYDSPVEEPFVLNSGISIWPTEILRLIAIVLSVALLFKAKRELKENEIKLAGKFEICGKDGSQEVGSRMMLKDRIASIWSKIKNYKEIGVAEYHDSLENTKESIDSIWSRYVALGQSDIRHFRTAIYVLVFLGFGLALMLLYGFPYNPIRGSKSQMLDALFLIGSVFCFLYLTFFIVDATRLCKVFIEGISRKQPHWNELTLDDYARQVSAAEKAGIAPLHEALLIRLIAERTEVVAKLVLYPFIVLFVMILSRANYFDKWSTPLHLAVIILLTAVYAWSCAFVLRRSSERARGRVLDRLYKIQNRATGQEKGLSELTKDIIEEVKNEHRGAFASFIHQPIVQALLMPFGGAGSVALIDFLDKMNF